MTLIAITDSLATGIPAIDGNHQILIRIINHIDDMMERDPQCGVDAATLTRLMRYAEDLLPREEHLMHVTGYPELPVHQQDHRRAQRFFHECRNDHLYGRVVHGSTTITFLSRWLSDHVLGLDMASAAYLRLNHRGTMP